MTILSNIYVDSNVSVVLANTSNLPNNNDIVVLLSTIYVPGRIVSVRDVFGNLSSTKRIIVSTMAGNRFLDNTSSIVLDQPYAFVTVNNLQPSVWVLQNTFAFPQQASAASLIGLTASYGIFSTIQIQTVLSTQVLEVSTLNVENVVAGRDVVGSGSLFLGEPGILAFSTNGNAAVGGSMYISSLLDVGWDTFLHRDLLLDGRLQAFSNAEFYGRVSTQGDFLAASSVRILGPTVTSSISSFGNIGFGNDVFLTGNTLNTRNLNAVNSISTTFLNTQVLSSGGFAYLNNVSSVGNVGIGADLFMTGNSLFSRSTFTRALVASNTLQTSTATFSTLNTLATANLSTVVASGTITAQNQILAPSLSTLLLQTSTINNTTILSTQTLQSQILTNTGAATFNGLTTFTSNISSLSTLGLGASLFMANQMLQAGTVSTVSTVTSNLTTGTLTSFINVSTVRVNATLVSTNQLVARSISANTLAGDGSALFNLPAISTLSLISTIEGLGTFGYVSTAGTGILLIQLQSTVDGLGNTSYISTPQLASTTTGIQALITSNTGFVTPANLNTGASTNVLLLSNYTVSTTLYGNFPGVGSNFTPIELVNEGGNTRMLISIRSGTTNQMTIGVDGIGNSEIRSLPNNRLNIFANEARFINTTNPALFTSIQSNTITTSSLTVNSLGGPGFAVPLSTVALFTSNTSNFASNALQNWSVAVSTVALFTSNTSNFASNILQNWSAAVSTVALFTSNTSNFASNALQNWSIANSTVALFTSNTSNFASNILQNWSTADSTISLFTSNTSNFASNILQNWSTPVSTLSTHVFTTLTSTVAGLSRTGYISTTQLFSTTAGLETYVSSFVTSYTANAYTGTVLYLNKSVTLGSNFTLDNDGTNNPVQQSTITSVPATSGNTFMASFITDFSLPAFVPAGFWDFNIFAQGVGGGSTFVFLRIYQVSSGGSSNLIATSPVSQAPGTLTQIGITPYLPYTLLNAGDRIRIEFFGSNSSGSPQNITLYWENQYYSHVHTTFGTLIPDTVLGSTVNGLGTAGYVSSLTPLSNYTANILQNWSSAVSSVSLYTSNTSNFSRNILQNWSSAVSSVSLYTSNTSNWASNILQNWSSAVSSVSLYTSNTSNFSRNILQDWSTATSSVSLYTSNTSNFSRNILQNWSTAVSSVALYTSNTSNYFANVPSAPTPYSFYQFIGVI